MSSQSEVNKLAEKLASLGENNNEKVEVLQQKLTQEVRVREQLEVTNKKIAAELQETFGAKIKDLEKELALMVQKYDFSKEENQNLQKQFAERS